MPTYTIHNVQEVDDAGGVHLETVATSGWIVESVNSGLLTLENNIRPVADRGKAKSKKKVARWAEKTLTGEAILGNLSIRMRPELQHELVFNEETGQIDLHVTAPEGVPIFDTAVDSQSRIESQLLAAKQQPTMFPHTRRNSVRIYIAHDEKAKEIGSEFNTKGDRVNDSPAKYAWASTPLEKVANFLVNKSGNPHTSSDNFEVMSNTVSAASHKLAGYNTLIKSLEQSWSDVPVSEYQIETQARYISECWSHLVTVRPEYGLSSVKDRRKYRDESIAGSALGIYGALAVIDGCFALGLTVEEAKPYLDKLTGEDWIAKTDPYWITASVVGPAILADGTTVLRTRNTFQSRNAVAKAFKARAGL